jgi:hypothetical protein
VRCADIRLIKKGLRPQAKNRCWWSESIGKIRFRPMYAQANMGHPSRTINLGGAFKSGSAIYAALLHPSGFTIRLEEAGSFNSLAAGRIGR